jgi:hypothetical protein
VLDALGWKARQAFQKYQKELLKDSAGAFFPTVKENEEHFDEEFTEVGNKSHYSIFKCHVGSHTLLPQSLPLLGRRYYSKNGRQGTIVRPAGRNKGEV